MDNEKLNHNCNKEQQCVLVAGSVHPDILAYYDENDENFVDRTGRIEYAVGGVAFNIAVNLTRHSVPVCLYSVMKKHSVLTEFIMNKLREHRINTDFIQFDENLPESGFVAHITEKQKQLISAVSCVAVEQAVLKEEAMLPTIANSEFVVIECNLSSEQIHTISKLAVQLNKTILMCVVSDAKVLRVNNVYCNSDNQFPVEVLSMNEKEAEVFFGNLDAEPSTICKQAKAKNVIVTQGKKGFSVYTANNGKFAFPSPDIESESVRTMLGAGDALFSAICDYLYNRKAISWEDPFILETIYSYIKEVML